MGTIIFWTIVVIAGYAVLRKFKLIPKLIGIRYGIGTGSSVINENNIVEQWSQLLVGMSGKGGELLKVIARKLQELNMPSVTFLRKEATFGGSNNKYEFIWMRHEKYPAYEFWVGAIDRAGQLKASWYLTVAQPNKVMGKMIAINKASREMSSIRMPRVKGMLGKMIAQKINEKLQGKPVPIRVRPDEMTMDDREELGTYITLAHQAVLGGLEEVMNNLNLDFSKVSKETEGFLNLS